MVSAVFIWKGAKWYKNLQTSAQSIGWFAPLPWCNKPGEVCLQKIKSSDNADFTHHLTKYIQAAETAKKKINLDCFSGRWRFLGTDTKQWCCVSSVLFWGLWVSSQAETLLKEGSTGWTLPRVNSTKWFFFLSVQDICNPLVLSTWPCKDSSNWLCLSTLKKLPTRNWMDDNSLSSVAQKREDMSFSVSCLHKIPDQSGSWGLHSHL